MTAIPPAAHHRPAHLRPQLIGLVMLGGTIGTAIRYAIETAFAASGEHLMPWATFGINISGAFLLGLLSELLVLLMADEKLRRTLQVTFGTGLLGGYTTYSSFALETIRLGETGHPYAALGYATGSVVLGFAAAYLAMIVARRVVEAAERGHR